MILVTNNYKLKYHSKPELLQLGFRYFGYDSTNEKNNYYIINFPVYKKNGHTVIEASIITDLLSGNVSLDIYDKCSHDPYPPFYYPERRYMYSNKFLKIMENNILKEFERMYVEECK